MNRQTKRLMQRQGQLGEDGSPAAKRPQPSRAAPKQASQRTSPITFLREVRGELRKVAWPSRSEVLNYSTVVLVTLIVLVGLIFVLDYVFARSVLFLFKT